MEQKAESEAYELDFINKVLHLNESSSHMGYWYINLVTRKIVYSDNIYRLYGLKPQAIPASLNVFLNFVHQEDREIVKEVTAKILHQQSPPDIEFRIVRQDGKVRYLSQKGKMVVYGESEMVMIVTVQDITPEKNSERKVGELTEQLSLNKFAQHQSDEMAQMGSWVWEFDTGVINWSDGIYTLLGLKPKSIELTQKMLTRYIHADDQHFFKDELKRTLQEEVDNNFECRVVRKGTIIHICADFKILNYKGKKVFIGILQDITKEKELQIELSEKIQLAEAITANMMDRAVITDIENTIRLWNQQCERIYHIKKEDAIGKNFFDVLPQLKNEEDIGQINRCLKGETISIPASPGTLLNEYHDLHMIPIKAEDGKVIGILHLLHDVTHEQQMQQHLNERLSFIESLMEASVNRIIVMDRHMNYLYCNQKAADFYNLSKADLIGKNVLEVFPDSINDPSYDQFRRALKGETVHIPALDGFLDEHYFEVYLIPIKDESGFVSAVLWTHYDLSGEIKMQRQLKKSNEILSSIDAAIVELDQEFRIRYLNTKAEFFIGHSLEQLAGQILWEALPKMIGSRSHEIILQVQKEKEKIED
ncbi:MAG TPA: PAS domain S-box protein, partial [Chitinophagaceae bacterium]|nr:PAS domain S-box protein [Chitinophagaceae bacterium]